MPWFYCDLCGDSIKKPALSKHFYQCGGQTFTCIDCCVTFDRKTVVGHSSCVTEHQKYALAATKPGGLAENGVVNSAAAGGKPADNEPSGLEFLSTRPPWKCNICNISCTSQDTLLSHAAGVKHKRRARAATAAANGEAHASQQPKPQPLSMPAKRPAAAPSSSSSSSASSSEDEAENKTTSKGKAAAKKKVKPAPPTSSSSSSSSDSSSEETAKPRKAAKQSKIAGLSAKAASDGSSSTDDESPAASKKDNKVGSKASSSSSSGTSSDEDNHTGSQKPKPGTRKSSLAHRVAFDDETKMGALAKLITKKLLKKGKVGPKLLRKLAGKRLSLSEKQLSPTVMKELRQQLETKGFKLSGKKLIADK